MTKEEGTTSRVQRINWYSIIGLILSLSCLGLCFITMGFWVGAITGSLFSIYGFKKIHFYRWEVFTIVSFVISLVIVFFLLGYAIYDGYSAYLETHRR